MADLEIRQYYFVDGYTWIYIYTYIYVYCTYTKYINIHIHMHILYIYISTYIKLTIEKSKVAMLICKLNLIRIFTPPLFTLETSV